MSPERAKVFIAEDDKVWLRLLVAELTVGGHDVVGTANTLISALRFIDEFEEKGVQIAVIDKNLTEGDSSGKDGRILITKIKERFPKITTIGMSMSKFQETDIDIGKDHAEKLVPTITNL